MWHLATLATIFSIVLGLMAVTTSLSMAVPIFTGQQARDAMMVGFTGLPVLQIALVAIGTGKEEAHSRTAIRLYAIAGILLIVLLAIPALAYLAR